MIQLTPASDEDVAGPVWVNPSFIICFYTSEGPDSGSEVVIVDADNSLTVKESPAVILQRIDGRSTR